MKFRAALALALTLLAGCSSRYHVASRDLEAAHTAGDLVVAARDDEGEPTWLELDAVVEARPLTPDLLEVQARDLRPAARIVGWTMIGLGLLDVGVGSRLHDLDDLALMVVGGTVALAGGALLIPGYASDGPEADAPPHVDALPPPR